MKKTVILIILSLIITSTSCPSTVNATYGNVKSAPKGALTKAQKDYLVAYTNYYVKQSQTLDATVYDGTDSGGYHDTYAQNDGSGLPNGHGGTNGAGKSYSNKLVLVCSVFTAAMLHQALGVDLEFTLSNGKWPSYRGSSYANPKYTNSAGKQYFIKVEENEYLEVGDVISCAGYSQHSMLYLGYDKDRGGHVIAETGGGKTIHITRMKGISAGDTPITLSQARQSGGYFSDGSTLMYGEASRLNPEIIPSDWKAPNKISIKWQSGVTETDYTPVYEPDDGHEHEWECHYDSSSDNTHMKICKLCKKNENEGCTFDYESVNETSHKGKCKCGRTIEENHTFSNGICTKCNQVEPKKILLGDANLDGVVSPTDALSVKRHIVELAVLPDEAIPNADMDADGKIGGTDLLQLKLLIIN